MLCQKLTGLLGICRKAGKMAIGFDPMLEVVRAGKAAGVVTAADSSPKTYKEVCYHCEKAGIPVVSLPLTQEELGRAIGRKAVVAAILDDGFFGRMQQLCAAQQAGD